MSNVLRKEKKQEVIALGRLGWTLRQIEEATGIRRETASRYLKEAGIAVRKPGWGQNVAPMSVQIEPESKPAIQVTTDSESKAAMGVTTGSAPKPAIGVTTDFIRLVSERSPILLPASNVSSSRCEPFRETIELQLGRGRNAMAIWQDLVDRHGFGGDYESVKRFVRKLRASPQYQPSGIIITEPGQELQVDYGTGPMVRDPQTGKYRRTRLFVATLGYSRKSIRLLTFTSSTRTWAELHETTFRRLGGCTRVVVLDNLKEGVLKPDIYDPLLNPLFKDMLAHYDVVALPCRVGDPDRKGKVESGVGHAQKTPLKGQRFESLEEAQAYLDNWETRWADTRIHGTTKRQVAAMFAEEQPFLLQLPLEPFRYYQYGQRVVHLDGCVEVEAAYYSTPPGWIGKLVNVQWDTLHVRILDSKTHQLLREHVRQQRGRHRIRPEDHPKKAPPGVTHLLARAARAGVQIGVFCEALHRQDGPVSIRRIQGVLAFVKKFGVAAVEDACAAALELRVYQYRFIRRYLERRPQLSLRQVDPLIRELTQYRELINLKTQEQNYECD